MPALREDLTRALRKVRRYSTNWAVVEITDDCRRSKDVPKFLVYDRTEGILWVGFTTGPFTPHDTLHLFSVEHLDGIDGRRWRIQGVTDEYQEWLMVTGLSSMELADLIFSCAELASHAA